MTANISQMKGAMLLCHLAEQNCEIRYTCLQRCDVHRNKLQLCEATCIDPLEQLEFMSFCKHVYQMDHAISKHYLTKLKIPLFYLSLKVVTKHLPNEKHCPRYRVYNTCPRDFRKFRKYGSLKNI